jgi:hypothetical protein
MAAKMAARSVFRLSRVPVAASVVDQLIETWRISSVEVASMLLAASHVSAKAAAEQSTKLPFQVLHRS